MHFRKTLIKAAEEAQASGEITRGELFRLRFASLRPQVAAQMEKCCAEQATSEGLMPAAGNLNAFDWTQLLAFIKELLPLILQIISIFSP
jgi:hypothetical protein